MNSELKRSAQSDTEREKQIELEWERLQYEALAAQRHRLEQELLQAKRQSSDSQQNVEESLMGLNLSNSLLIAGLVALGGLGIVIVAFAW